MGDCPNGWHEFEKWNKCYRYFSTRTSWLKAQTDCRNNGGDLASIDDQDSNDFITGTVAEEVVDQAFIGGRQFAENGYGADHWAWIDGKTKFDWNNNWANGNKDWGNENCMSIFLGNHEFGKWNDLECSRDNWFPYICSKWNTVDGK